MRQPTLAAKASAWLAFLNRYRPDVSTGLEPYADVRHVFTELPKAYGVEVIEAHLPLSPHPTSLLTNTSA